MNNSNVIFRTFLSLDLALGNGADPIAELFDKYGSVMPKDEHLMYSGKRIIAVTNLVDNSKAPLIWNTKFEYNTYLGDSVSLFIGHYNDQDIFDRDGVFQIVSNGRNFIAYCNSVSGYTHHIIVER